MPTPRPSPSLRRATLTLLGMVSMASLGNALAQSTSSPPLDLRWHRDLDPGRILPVPDRESPVGEKPLEQAPATASGIAPAPLPPVSFSSTPRLAASEEKPRRAEDFATVQADQVKMRFRGAQRLDFSYATSKSSNFNVQLDARKNTEQETIKVFHRWAF